MKVCTVETTKGAKIAYNLYLLTNGILLQCHGRSYKPIKYNLQLKLLLAGNKPCEL